MVKYNYAIAFLDSVVELLAAEKARKVTTRQTKIANERMGKFLSMVHKGGWRIISILPIEGQLMYTLEREAHGLNSKTK